MLLRASHPASPAAIRSCLSSRLLRGFASSAGRLQASDLPEALRAGPAKDVWLRAVAENRGDALALRSAVYDQVRSTQKFEPWQLDILGLIPPEETLLSDYMFSVDVLVSQQEWPMIKRLLADLASTQPVFVEVLCEELVKRVVAAKEGPALVGPLVEVFIGVLGSLGSNLGDLDPLKDRPFIQSFKHLLREFPGPVSAEAQQLVYTNPPVGSSLASTLLQLLAVDKSDAGAESNVSKDIWQAKIATDTATPEDLHNVMLRQVYLGDSAWALGAYDAHPELQRESQADALLLAAAQARDWDRLQAAFERLAHSFEGALQSRHYGIILQALGQLGGRNLLEDIFKRYTASHPPSRGVFHAMMYSYRAMGDAPRARYYFDLMVAEDIEPVRATFQLLLAAYKEAKDLAKAMDVVELASSTYHLPVTNKEVTVLLALCANRRDLESARRIFEWGQSLLGAKCDRITYNAYLQALVECNQLDEAWQVYETLPVAAGLDTLTIMLSAAARWQDQAKFELLLLEKERLGLRSDAKWFGAVMSFYALGRNSVQLFKTFEAMKQLGIRPGAGHYALLLDHLTKLRDFERGEEIVQEVMDEQVTPTFSFYEHWFRLMTASRSTPAAQTRGYQMLSKILDMGVFDASATTTPRDAAPPGILKAVIRKMLKKDQFERAYALLSRANRQRPAPEPWRLAALFLEYYDASARYEALGQAWSRFLASLRQTFVPTTLPSGEVVFRLPRRYRFDYERQIDVRIRDLGRRGNVEGLLNLENHVGKLGLELSSANLNHLVQDLLALAEGVAEMQSRTALGLRTRAFDIAESRLAAGFLANLKRRRLKAAGEDAGSGHFHLSRRSIAALAGALPRIESGLAKKFGRDKAQALMAAQFKLLVPILQRATAARDRRAQP